MGDLVKATSGAVAPAYVGPVEHIIARIMSGAERVRFGKPLMLMVMPTKEERQQLVARQIELANALRHNDSIAKGIAVSDMLGCYFPRNDEDKKKTITKFMQELGDVPTWAVVRACDLIRSGGASDYISLYHRPTTIQVRMFALRQTEPAKAELHKIGEILTGQPIKVDPEQAERIKEMIDELVSKFRAAHREDPQRIAALKRTGNRMREQNDAAILREYEARGFEPIFNSDGRPISYSLARQGLRPLKRLKKRGKKAA